MKENQFYIYSFYHFLLIKDKEQIKYLIENFLNDKIIRGTILLAEEGINASISGCKIDLDNTIAFIEKILMINIIDVKVNEADYLPFNKIKVRLKKEIISFGQGNIDVNKYRGRSVDPVEWNKAISNPNTLILDTRNSFEISIGKFNDAVNS